MKRMIILILTLALVLSCGANAVAAETDAVQKIVLDSRQEGAAHKATLNGEAVPEYDYTWHADPSQAHEDVKNSPAEYFTGTAPSGEDAVYIAHDIVYYPLLEESKFQKVNYDGEMEWVYRYEAEGYTDYLFSTLPSQREGFPSHMMHSEEEAYRNAVLHITQPGTYELTGTWHGQIWIDLGEDAFYDPAMKVTLILNGVDITCTVAPGLVFANVYECDNGWEDADSYSQNVDTSEAGANVILADGTVNNVSGTNIFRILKTKFKDEDSTEEYPAQKKAWKIDGAFYSYQSMNITGQAQGSGVLNITSGFEGLNSELHLTINGGNVNIYSQDDGININEDGVSVLTVNGGNLHICAGLGSEGDGIDSNGFLTINGGTVITTANPAADSGLDSDCGSFVSGGTVVALGAAMDWAEADETAAQPVLNLRFGTSQSADEAIVITDTQGKVVFAYDPDKDEVTGEHQRTYQGAILSGPGLEIGGEYQVYIGGDVTGSEVSGVYDAATVTDFTGASIQGWSGTAIGGFGGFGGFGGGRGGGMPQNMENRGDRQPPEGFDPGQLPEGMEQPEGFQQPPQGMEQPPEDFQQAPEGMGQPPEGFDPGQMFPGGFGGMGQTVGATCTYDTVFSLKEQVNAFASVSDIRHDLQAEGSGYTCTACGQQFADEAGTVPASETAGNLWIWVCAAAAVVVLTAAVLVLVLRRRKKA